MHEVLSESIRWVNLPFTVLLGLVVFYWLMVGIGVLDTSLFGHIDTDAHIDFHGGHDLHADAQAGTEVHAHPLIPGDPHLGNGGIHKDLPGGYDANFLIQVLAFLNVGRVPVMFVLSVLALCLWLGSMIANHYFTGGSVGLAAAFLLPNFVVSFIATRYLTLPFRPLFRVLTREADEETSVVGQRCVITTSEATPQFGQAEISTSGASLLLNVRTLNDARLVKGEPAVVVRIDEDRSLYFIAPFPKSTSDCNHANPSVH